MGIFNLIKLFFASMTLDKLFGRDNGVATNGISSTSHKNEKGSMTNYDPDFYRDEIQVSNEEYQNESDYEDSADNCEDDFLVDDVIEHDYYDSDNQEDIYYDDYGYDSGDDGFSN